MENQKKCPVGLTGFSHYCPDDASQHEPLSKIQGFLERKFKGKTSADIANEPWNQAHWDTLQFIRTGERPIETKATVTAESMSKPAESPLTAGERMAVDAITKLKAGIPFNRSFAEHAPQVETEPIKTMSFEEEVIHTWKNDPSVRAEFVSLASYQAFRRAEKAGRTKVHKGCVTK